MPKGVSAIAGAVLPSTGPCVSKSQKNKHHNLPNDILISNHSIPPLIIFVYLCGTRSSELPLVAWHYYLVPAII